MIAEARGFKASPVSETVSKLRAQQRREVDRVDIACFSPIRVIVCPLTSASSVSDRDRPRAAASHSNTSARNPRQQRTQWSDRT